MAFIGKTARELLRLYDQGGIPRAAAALSYYLTMTFFPLIICVYSLLGYNYLQAMRVLSFLSQFISSRTTDMLRSFLTHVAVSHSTGMLVAGLTLLVTTSSAAARTLLGTIGEMQGKQRFRGLNNILFSVLFSLAFVAAVYFAILVLFTGKDFLELLNGWLPFVDISSSWRWIRFFLLGGISFVLLLFVYSVPRWKTADYRIYPGAIFSTLGILAICLLFSEGIAASTRYPLVYGSLASIILLMIWLFFNCQIIYLGAALNLALERAGAQK